VAGENRVGEGGGAGRTGGDPVVRGIDGVRVSFELDEKKTRACALKRNRGFGSSSHLFMLSQVMKNVFDVNILICT